MKRFLICSNGKCKEKTAVVGQGEFYATSSHNPVGPQYRLDRYKVYFPKYFEPALNIFIVPSSCPQDIKLQIEKSFTHFFNDLNACANAVRTSLELIMDQQGVEKISKNGNPINLGIRIKDFNLKNPIVKPFIEAVKWIGNAGSHVSGVVKNDVLDGYELLQFVISELYEKEEIYNRLTIKANAINEKNNPGRK